TNSLLGVGALPTTPKATAEYERGYLCGLIRGDGHLGTYTDVRAGRPSPDTVHRFRLALADDEALQRARHYLAHGGIETTELVFTSASDARQGMRAIRAQSGACVSAVRDLIAWPQ